MAAKWTFMVYMAGFNNLSAFATKDLNEMRKVGSNDQVKIAVFLKQLSDKSAYRLLVGKDGKNERKERLGAVDSGSPQTMVDFVRWAVKTAPAERYALIVWNHGSGWEPGDLDDLYEQVRSERGDTGVTSRELGLRSSQVVARSLFDTTVKEILSLSDAGERAIASDDGTGHSLDTIELNRVLEKARAELGHPLDLLGMDACLMSTLEVAYEAQQNVSVVVGSEELEPGDGWPYDAILADLAAKPDMDGAALGQVIVDRYVKSYGTRQGEWPVTQCAVKTSQMAGFAKVLDGLASALKDHMGNEVDAAKVLRAQSRSARFTGDLVDLKSFCTNLVDGTADAAIKDAAKAVTSSLAPGSDAYVLGEGHLGPTVDGCGGVTVYFPPPSSSISEYYADLAFAKQQAWDDFLESYRRAIRGE